MEAASLRAGRVFGVLNMLKPSGMTSHDVVSHVRRLTGGIKAGHGGTLDPGAAGVLPVALGSSTRLLEYCLGWDKEYVAEITFGVSTSSDDAQGTILSETPAEWLTERDVTSALSRIAERREQRPPRVCALKYEGKRLYRLAAQKESVPLEPRPVMIYRMEVKRWEPGPRPRAVIKVICSHGTYIRSIARDAGEELGVGAHVSFLVRTRSGRFSVDKAITLEELEEEMAKGGLPGLERILMDPAEVLDYMPAVKLDRRGFMLASNGSLASRNHIVEWLGPVCPCVPVYPNTEEKRSVPGKTYAYPSYGPRDILSGGGLPGGARNEGALGMTGSERLVNVRLLSEDGAFFGVGCVDHAGRVRPLKITNR
ncbi:MAG TPA: tRNA pseudouridine(55) synthase TruB [Clostridia bacterium]|nr:tRNA pseudouridine(55) synthase TruB [Clostridia bacterium]